MSEKKSELIERARKIVMQLLKDYPTQAARWIMTEPCSV